MGADDPHMIFVSKYEALKTYNIESRFLFVAEIRDSIVYRRGHTGDLTFDSIWRMSRAKTYYVVLKNYGPQWLVVKLFGAGALVMEDQHVRIGEHRSFNNEDAAIAAALMGFESDRLT